MAVEYEISSDVATITGVASNTQVASIVKFYTGSITYDDEPTSKYASVTINGKTQRVMLCVAVSGTVVYDDVPCLYSTVSGHRTLNVVEPTESGTPDDVPSLYETVVVDGKTVRALRCVLINQTPIYDGVSSTCTFVENGKTHTAQLVNKIVGGSVEVIVKGTSPLSLPDAVAGSLSYVKAFGGTEQRNLPDGYTALEYIESTGTQYIDTGVAGNTYTDVNMRVKLGAISGGFLFGTDTLSKGNRGIQASSDKLFLSYGGREFGGSYIYSNVIYDLKTHYQSGQSTITLDNSLYVTNTSTAGTIVSNNNLFLFARNSTGNVGAQSMTLYSAQIYNGSTLVRDFVPAKNSSGVVGMYDTVSGQFFTNQGTGDFVAGPTVVPTPTAPMDIVSNNGALKAFKTLNISTYDTSASDAGIDITFDGVTDRRRWDTLNDSGTSTNHYENGFVSIYMNPTRNNYFAKALVNGVVYDGSVYNTGEQIYTWDYTITKNIDIYCPTINADGIVETINVHGKNLFDGQWQQGVYNTINGGYVPNVNNRVCNVNIIQVKPSTNYTVSCPDYALASGMRWLFYDANKNFIASTTGVTTITTPSNAKYINFYIANDLTVATAPDLQVEQGSATTYEPYFNGGNAVAETLLKISSDYQDQQEIIDGTVTRKVGIKVFDGTESWYYTATNKFSIYLANGRAEDNQDSAYCSHFAYIKSATFPTTDMYFSLNKSSAQCRFSLYYTAYTSADDFKQFLAEQYAAGTPVIIVYPLATPTTESVTGQTLQVQAGDNTLEITQASLDNLELEAQYQASVSLTIQEVQDANLDPNVEVTII